MLDAKRIRQNPEEVCELLKRRNHVFDISRFLADDDQRRLLLAQSEEKKAERNNLSKRIGIARRDRNPAELSALMDQIRILGQEIDRLDQLAATIDVRLNELLQSLPNLPHPTVPEDSSGLNNSIIRTSETPRSFDWEPKSHRELAMDLGLVMPNADSRLTPGYVYRGTGAKLERVLAQFVLNTYCEGGYEELFGSLSFSEDTQEWCRNVSGMGVFELYRNSVLDSGHMPVCHCWYTKSTTNTGENEKGYPSSCVSLAQMTTSEESDTAFDKMLHSIEQVFSLLKIPYRIIQHATGALDFCSARTMVLEVWLPSQKTYVEAAQCSSHEGYVARSLGMRYRTQGEKPRTLHTLCGIGASMSVLFASILENHQFDDGSVGIPDVLIPYMQCDRIAAVFS